MSTLGKLDLKECLDLTLAHSEILSSFRDLKDQTPPSDYSIGSQEFF